MGEFTFIERLRRRLASGHTPNKRLVLHPGDDCAVIANHGDYLFAADMLMDGVHFNLTKVAPTFVGRKALAVNLSDVAAMAGTPESITVSLALPRKGASVLADSIMDGIATLARDFDVSIAGGDTNAWDGPFVVSIAVTGSVHARGSVTRAGARPGDVIFVTGALGGSLMSGRHLTFEPRVREARMLHDRYHLSSMIDLSDGLGSDIMHILAQSGMGAILSRTEIPVHADIGGDVDPVARALMDGEDFELAFTVSEAAADRIEADVIFGERLPLTRIGVIQREPGLFWSDGSPVVARGFVHELN